MDITDPVNPRRITAGSSSDNYTFRYSTTPGTRFIAQSSPYTPRRGNRIDNQNLRGISGYPDYIIITSELFLDEARELADYRRDNDNLTPVIVTQNQIFNEFSGGVPDVRAIRDYVKYLYDRAPVDALPSYLLLFGDATFDFKGVYSTSANTNHVFTYQSEESLDRINSFGSDDYFGLLSDDEGLWPQSSTSERIDIGMGGRSNHQFQICLYGREIRRSGR